MVISIVVKCTEGHFRCHRLTLTNTKPKRNIHADVADALFRPTHVEHRALRELAVSTHVCRIVLM